jgi:hypothetical protein
MNLRRSFSQVGTERNTIIETQLVYYKKSFNKLGNLDLTNWDSYIETKS